MVRMKNGRIMDKVTILASLSVLAKKCFFIFFWVFVVKTRRKNILPDFLYICKVTYLDEKKSIISRRFNPTELVFFWLILLSVIPCEIG